MTYKITIDKEACTGCGLCVTICEDTFEMGEEGISKVIKSPSDSPCVVEAKDSCPSGAITIEEG